MPIVLDHACELLKTKALLTVSHEEVEIMKWPEDDLYDKSVLER
jgi:hypothetical protein